MRIISKLFSTIWQILTKREEIERLENEVRRLSSQLSVAQMEIVKLKERIKRNARNKDRESMWDKSSDNTRKSILKSRFNK